MVRQARKREASLLPQFGVAGPPRGRLTTVVELSTNSNKRQCRFQSGLLNDRSLTRERAIVGQAANFGCSPVRRVDSWRSCYGGETTARD